MVHECGARPAVLVAQFCAAMGAPRPLLFARLCTPFSGCIMAVALALARMRAAAHREATNGLAVEAIGVLAALATHDVATQGSLAVHWGGAGPTLFMASLGAGVLALLPLTGALFQTFDTVMPPSVALQHARVAARQALAARAGAPPVLSGIKVLGQAHEHLGGVVVPRAA